MRAFLDDQPLELAAPSVAAAVDAARLAAEQQGRIIVDVLADGGAIEAGLLDQPPADDAGISEIRLITADPASFVSVTLTDAADALEEAKAEQHRAAELIQQGQTDEAAEPIAAALATWGAVRDVVEKSARLVGFDPGAQAVKTEAGDETTGEALIAELAEKLTDLREALAGGDWVSLADVLAYDLDGLADRWVALLRALSERVAS